MTNQERAYLETEYSCAYCGIKDKKSLTVDHIDGRKIKKIEIEEIKKIKKILLGKTLTVFGVNALKMAKRNKYGVTAIPFLLMHMIEMKMLKMEEILCEESVIEDGRKTNSIVSEARYTITEEGKRIYKKWF